MTAILHVNPHGQFPSSPLGRRAAKSLSRQVTKRSSRCRREEMETHRVLRAGSRFLAVAGVAGLVLAGNLRAQELGPDALVKNVTLEVQRAEGSCRVARGFFRSTGPLVKKPGKSR